MVMNIVFCQIFNFSNILNEDCIFLINLIGRIYHVKNEEVESVCADLLPY